MTVIIADRVLEITNSAGTGNLTLAGTLPGYRRFVDVCAVNDTFFGAIVAVDANDAPTGQWETGYYTFQRFGSGTSSDPYVYQIARTYPLSQPTPVSFAAGRKQVFIDYLSYQIKNTGVPSYVFTNVRWFGDARVKGVDGAATGGALVVDPVPKVTANSLPDLPPFVFYNEGVNANTTRKQLDGTNGQHPMSWSSLMAALPDDKVMILQYGASDAFDGISTSDYQLNLQTMINTAKSAGKYVIVCTPPVTGERDLAPYASAAIAAATATSCNVIDFFAFTTSLLSGPNAITIQQMLPDGFHPTQAVYTQMGQYAASRWLTFNVPTSGTA